jgi:hypothetical protein
MGPVDTSYQTRGDIKPPGRFSYREQLDLSVFDQGFIPACVGYSIASAVAIRLNQYCNLKCACIRIVPPFSAAFIYNQVSGGKPNGISLTVALDTLSKQGICPESVFKNDRHTAHRQPDRRTREIARQYCFWESERVFHLPREIENDEARDRISLEMLKTHLYGGKPVIAGLRCSAGFINFRGKVYTPEDLPRHANHAAVVIGYDDETQTVEVLNSFGPKWGDAGFVRIRYPDFFRMARYAYVVKLNGVPGEACNRK